MRRHYVCIGRVIVVPGSALGFDNRNPFPAKFNQDAELIYFAIIGDSGFDIGTDLVKMDEFVYVVGYTQASNFPVTLGSGSAVLEDGFLAKFKENDGVLSASRLIGGNRSDFLTSIDAKFGKIYLAGRSTNQDLGANTFPMQAQTGSYSQGASSFGTDGIILEVGVDLSLLWSSFFGGAGADFVNEVLIKGEEEAEGFYLVGNTDTYYYSDDDCVPPTDGGFPNCQLGMADQLAPANGYPTSGFYTDLFIAEFEDNHPVWTTFLGGEKDDIISVNSQSNIAINPSDPDEISIIGSTNDFSTFPTNPLSTGYHQSNNGGNVIATFKARQLFWLTSFGCPSAIFNDSNGGETINYSNGGHLMITGTAGCTAQAVNDYCTDPSTGVFPICPPSTGDFFFQETFGGFGLRDCYLARFNPAKELTYSSYLGGSGTETVGSAAYSNTQERIFIVGHTTSPNFPVEFPLVGNSYKQGSLAGDDGFIARINLEIVTGVQEEPLASGQGLALYPNPSTRNLQIVLAAPISQNAVLRLFDSSGRLIRQVIIEQHASGILLEVSELPAGIYYVALGHLGASFIKH